MKSDQELFEKGLATYQKVVAANYMAHWEVYETLRQVLLDEASDGFVFADLACGTAPGSAAALACGTAPGSAAALAGSNVARYIGIDISQPSLDAAKEALAPLTCPVELRCGDFVAAIDSWKGPLDVVWIGQSLHHLLAPDKRNFMRKIRDLLPRDGLFLIWEPTRLESEDREGWLERFHKIRPEWGDGL
ncbi:class I SAM-dependent methyltransferase [Mesorhizobium qingshengii]|uniref:Methyltransferase domain-containing protein n=1 Tax=Mesorhizobium qingshengii TaxID=1165689 RepID=A0A1G5YDI6_9HYPH|nr:class I SAM-dependent methyltransferase [Mesorhizobium qingshengii]SDA80284.1 Methyltransferase domain-containing protein [Mesorhizobium qingshengii]